MSFTYKEDNQVQVNDVIQYIGTNVRMTKNKLYVVEVVDEHNYPIVTDDNGKPFKLFDYKVVKTLDEEALVVGDLVIIVDGKENSDLPIGTITIYKADGRFHTNQCKILVQDYESLIVNTKLLVPEGETNVIKRYLTRLGYETISGAMNEEIHSYYIYTTQVSKQGADLSIKKENDEYFASHKNKEVFWDGANIVFHGSQKDVSTDQPQQKENTMNTETPITVVMTAKEYKAYQKSPKEPKSDFKARNKFAVTTYDELEDFVDIERFKKLSQAQTYANAYLQDAKAGSKATISKEIRAIKRKDTPVVDC